MWKQNITELCKIVIFLSFLWSLLQYHNDNFHYHNFIVTRLSEGSEAGDDKVVTDLRTELWEKERKLTDIRLEALSSAHQLEQLQEAMNNMQVYVILFFCLFHKKVGLKVHFIFQPDVYFMKIFV